MSDKEIDHGRRLPICLRKYSRGDVECDGRPRAKSDRERIPCVYRDRCVALQRFIKIKGIQRRELLKLRKVKDSDGKRRVYAFSIEDSEKFQQRLIRIIDRYGIRNGRITISHPQEERRKPRKMVERTEEAKEKSRVALVKARKEASRAITEKADKDVRATNKLVQWFVLRFEKKVGRKVHDSRDGIDIGELFIVDRVESNRYVVIYAKTYKIRDGKGKKKTVVVETRTPVVRINLATRTHTLQFRVTIAPNKLKKVLSKNSTNKIGVIPFRWGRFKAKTFPVDMEGCSIVADGIAKAVLKGIIKLPDICSIDDIDINVDTDNS